MRFRPLLLAIFILASLAGCSSRDSQLRRKWSFDFQYTLDQLKSHSSGPGGKSAGGGLSAGLQAIQSALVIKEFHNSTLTITRKEMTYLFKTGEPGTQTYEVVARPGPNEWRIKSAADGRVETYTLEGGHLDITMHEIPGLRMYYKPADK